MHRCRRHSCCYARLTVEPVLPFRFNICTTPPPLLKSRACPHAPSRGFQWTKRKSSFARGRLHIGPAQTAARSPPCHCLARCLECGRRVFTATDCVKMTQCQERRYRAKILKNREFRDVQKWRKELFGLIVCIHTFAIKIGTLKHFQYDIEIDVAGFARIQASLARLLLQRINKHFSEVWHLSH